jgi:hypothetical protein
MLLRDWTRQTVIIEPFDVPPSLVKDGYDGKAIASLLRDKMVDAAQQARALREIREVATKSASLDVPLPGTGLSLQTLTQLIRTAIGRKSPTISANIFDLNTSPRTLLVVLRTSLPGRESVFSEKGSLDDILSKLAIDALSEVDPIASIISLAKRDDNNSNYKALSLAHYLELNSKPELFRKC